MYASQLANLLALLAVYFTVADGRLLQPAAGQLGCSGVIPACLSRRCLTRTLNNVDTVVCPRCMPTFVPVKGADGQSTVQCGKPPGALMGAKWTTSQCKYLHTSVATATTVLEQPQEPYPRPAVQC